MERLRDEPKGRLRAWEATSIANLQKNLNLFLQSYLNWIISLKDPHKGMDQSNSFNGRFWAVFITLEVREGDGGGGGERLGDLVCARIFFS